MSEDTNNTQYDSPNIIIVPTMSCDNAENKTSKDDTSSDNTSKSIPTLIQRTTTNSQSCMDNAEKNVKHMIWAKNYLPSIGLSYEKSVLNQRGRMDSSQNSTNVFFTQDSVPTMDAPQSNMNYTDFNDQSHEDNSGFVNYINLSQTTQIGVKMPGTSYPGAYVNENNNYSYYYNQPLNNYTAYYNPTPTTVNVNLPTTYLNTFRQPSHDIGNNASPMVTYYDPNTSSTFVSNQNIQSAYSDINNENTPTANNFAKTTIKSATTPTPLVDENLTTSCCGTINKCTKFPITSNQSNDVRCGQRDQESATNSIVKKKCCDCMCSKVNSEEEKKYRQVLELKSSIQANEKTFRDFLIKMDRPPEQKKKQIISKETSPKDISTKLKSSKKSKHKKNITKRPKSSVQENEKAFRIFLQKLKIEKELELRKLEKINVSSKKTSSKDTSSSNVQATAYSEKDKKYRDPKEQEEKRPKFIKTKYVDEQEPQYQPKVKNSSSEDLPITSTNLSTIGYLENDITKTYKFPKDEEKRPKFIKTKYVDEQEPEYKPIKKARIDINYDNKKCSTINSDSTYIKLKRSRDDSQSSERKSRTDDNSYKTSKTDEVKYYKCTEDRREIRKITPVKSIVKISEKHEKINKSPRCRIFKNEDLRETLSRKLQKTPSKLEKRERQHDIPKRKLSEDSNDSLVVTVNNKLSENKDDPKNSKNKQKSKNASCKKINLVINIVYKEPGSRSRSESDKSDSDNHSPQTNVDLSFLDDFNVDEIVASLNKTEKIVTRQISQNEESNVTNSEEERNKLDTSNAFSQRENPEFSEAKMILQKGDVLNNLLSKEASLLDSLRTIHQEIQSKKRSCMVKETDKVFADNTDYGLSQKKSKDAVDYLLSVKQDVKYFTQPIKDCVTKEPNASDSSLNAIMEHIKLFNDTQNKEPLNKRAQNSTTSDDDIIFQKKIDETEQAELIRILEDTTDDALGLIEKQINIATNSLLPTPHLQDKVLNVLTIIDLSNEDSTDSNEIKLSKQNALSKVRLDDDVYIVEETKKDHETIDLTTDENSNNLNTKKSFNFLNAVTKIQKQGKGVIKKDSVTDKELLMKDATNQKPRKNNITTKIVNATKDSIVSMQINESLNIAVDSLEKYAVKRLPTTEINTTKEAVLDNSYSVKVKEIANIQDVSPNNQSDICHNDKDMECDNSVFKTLTEDPPNKPQIIENGTTIVSESISCSDVENEKNKIKDNEIIVLGTYKSLETDVKVEESTKSHPVPEAQAEVTPDKTSKDINEHGKTKTLTEGASITQTSEQNASETISEIFTSFDEQNEKDRNYKMVESQMNNSEIKVGNDKIVEFQINKSKAKVNVDKKLKSKDVKLSKSQTDIPKTEVSTIKSVPTTTGTKEKLNFDKNMLKSEVIKSNAQTDISRTEASTTKSMSSTSGTNAKLNVDGYILKSEDVKSKAQTDISKTEGSTTKLMPLTSGTNAKLNVYENILKSEDVKSKAQTDISETEASTTKLMPSNTGTNAKLNVDGNILKSEDVKSKAQTDISKIKASTTQSKPSTFGTKEKLNVDGYILKSEDVKSKAQTDISKTKTSTTKLMPSISGTNVKLNDGENILKSKDVKSKAQTDTSKTEATTTKLMPSISGTNVKLNDGENILKSEDVKSKAQTDTSKTEACTTKLMPSTSGTNVKLNVENILNSEDVKSKAQTDISKTEATSTKSMPTTSGTKEKINFDENKLKSKDVKSKAQTDTQKTEANSTKAMPLTSGTKVNSSLPTVKKENTSINADVKTEEGNKKSTVLPHHNMIQIPIIAERIEQEMFNIFKQKYSVIGLIHAGAYSKVFHFHSKGHYYAVKSLNRWSATEQQFYKQAEKNDMLFSMQRGTTRISYGCVYLVNSFAINGHMCFMMDYYPKNLRQALEDNGKPFHINVVQHLARQLVSAVMLLKSHNVVHLDISPRHILLNHKNNKLKLCGFDEARYVNQIPRNPKLGSINYRPPEVIVGYKLGFDIDVWATGLVLYEMATCIKLFPGTHNNGILFKQMCTLGALPIEMIHRSQYSHEHFTGSSFKCLSGKNFDKINLITKFFKSKRIETTIMKAYNENWRNTASQLELQADNDKILNLTVLLREILVVNPSDRIPIQFVNGSAFITN